MDRSISRPLLHAICRDRGRDLFRTQRICKVQRSMAQATSIEPARGNAVASDFSFWSFEPNAVAPLENLLCDSLA